MPKELNIVIAQTDIRWHRATENCLHLEQLFEQDSRVVQCDVVVLPEMFNSGFTMQASAVAEPMTGATVRWMQKQAKRLDAVVTGTLVISDRDSFYNRLIWATPDGNLAFYDKRHLFRMAEEHRSYTAGNSRPIFALGRWRIRPITCYDLRFPVWCRSVRNDYDVLVCPANWPSPRHPAWVTLLQARAIENQSYVLAANRVGIDDHNKSYLGGSMAIDAKGIILADGGDAEGLVFATLNHDALTAFRNKFPVNEDADAFTLG